MTYVSKNKKRKLLENDGPRAKKRLKAENKPTSLFHLNNDTIQHLLLFLTPVDRCFFSSTCHFFYRENIIQSYTITKNEVLKALSPRANPIFKSFSLLKILQNELMNFERLNSFSKFKLMVLGGLNLKDGGYIFLKNGFITEEDIEKSTVEKLSQIISNSTYSFLQKSHPDAHEPSRLNDNRDKSDRRTTSNAMV